MSQASPDGSDIKFHPTDGLTTNPNEALYWNAAALDKELHRSFELCHSCRMCFKFCQSFPTLFDAVDTHGDVRKIPAATRDRIVDECFQCKLCYTQCPYTEAEHHAFKLDFPRLMLRAKAIRRRRTGIPLRERMLADPDKLGRIGCSTAALANWAHALKPGRVVMEALGGIHREKHLPRFESETFEQWLHKELGPHGETNDGEHRVVLFATCFVNYNRTSIGKAAVEVLRHNNCRIACPKVACCGMPALDCGDIDLARKKARRNVEALLPYVERGYKIAVVNPTCSLMMRQEYPELLNDPDDHAIADAARRVAEATRDISEFLFELRAEGVYKNDYRSTPAGAVAYHAACHLRMQGIGFRGRDLIRTIPEAKPKLVAECCGHDGTWAMKKEYFDLAMENGKKAFDGMRAAEAGLWVSDCPLAAIQFQQACGKESLHPVEVLARAYRENGFAKRLGPQPEGKTT
jgi:glycerol-3-phosphate dehydrogenase subunit C